MAYESAPEADAGQIVNAKLKRIPNSNSGGWECCLPSLRDIILLIGGREHV